MAASEPYTGPNYNVKDYAKKEKNELNAQHREAATQLHTHATLFIPCLLLPTQLWRDQLGFSLTEQSTCRTCGWDLVLHKEKMFD